MSLRRYLFTIIGGIFFSLLFGQAVTPVIKLDDNKSGISSMIYGKSNGGRNYVNRNDYLGNLHIRYIISGKVYNINLSDLSPIVQSNNSQDIKIAWQLPGSIEVNQSFFISENDLDWDIIIYNRGKQTIEITDMRVHIPIGERNEMLPAKDNLARHISLNGNSSYLYWLPYHGQDNVLLMTMKNGTSLEYKDIEDNFYFHSKTSVDRINDSWRFPSTSKIVSPNKSYTVGFNFSIVEKYTDVQDKLYNKGCVVVKIVPGMVVSSEMDVHCALASKQKIKILEPEYPQQIQIVNKGKSNKKCLYDFRFSRLGENMITIKYGKENICYLNFYVTEPLETVIKKRASFIVNNQQHRDTTKWYNGLYSLWDMENKELLSPENLGGLPYPYMVGGSDDPSNCKPLYLSEKNVIYPDKDEIASLEYYEKNFVWGKLQRTNNEYPYPYGIYGCDNWYELRSGACGDYNSGGSGKERMWRTYDYPTHFTIYYNLYRIAKDYPHLVTYLDAKGYLERAYRTAMAYFEVPYNIFMGKQWAIKGWSDWAYKIGNFHERYLLDIMQALKIEGREDAAKLLQKEWEKKVLYMIYEDPWPFGSEMFVDRTAYESSYYVAEYAKNNKIFPQEQLWYDKNRNKWYSYKSLDSTKVDSFMQNQLDANLAIRGLYEPDFAHLGTAWSGGKDYLDYMSQMGGAAILDYAFRFSRTPELYVNWGYNSLLSSWALVNTGTETTNYGYWYAGKVNDGAAGWIHSPYQHSFLWDLKSVKLKRGSFRCDGEIDHGLTGGIHGTGIYLLKDSDFDLISYGGNTKVDKDGNISIIPYDGVRRQLRLFTPIRASIELKKDGFSKDEPIILTSNNEVCFFIENREERKHKTKIFIETNKDILNLSVSVLGKGILTRRISSGKYEAIIPIEEQKVAVKIKL